jgi:hypothetical protein
MSIVTKANAQGRANTIRNETVTNANTCERVGSLFRDMVDSMWPAQAVQIWPMDWDELGTGWREFEGAHLGVDQVDTTAWVREWSTSFALGTQLWVPAGASTITTTYHYRPVTAPTGAAVAAVAWSIKPRGAAWVGNVAIQLLPCADGSTDFQSYTETLDLETMGIEGGNLYSFELMRLASSENTLASVLNLELLTLSWG